MADFDAQLPVRSTATEFTTEVANASGTTINPAEDYAQASTTSGQNGVLAQGAVTTSAPTYSTGTTNPLSLDTSGNLRVTVDSSTSLQNVNLTELAGTTLGAPSNYGTSPGAVEVIGVNAYITNTVPVTLASTTITGTVAVTQSTSPWVVSLSSTTITGTVTVAGNLTNNSAAPSTTNIGVLPAVAAASAPTWTTGDQVLLSENLSGFLRTTDSSDGSVSGGTAGTTSLLAGGVYNSSSPTLTNGQQASLQLTSSGALIVSTTGGSITQTFTYVDNSSVAAGSSVSQSVAGPINLDQVIVSASGEVKVVIAIGVTGSEATKIVGFTSAANKNFVFTFEDTYVIPSGSDVKVTITNRDTASMDLYSTIVNH